MEKTIDHVAKQAKEASRILGKMSTQKKNQILLAIADAVESHSQQIIEANQMDLKNAKENGVPTVMQDRLLLDQKRIQDMAEGVRQVVALSDPIGEVVEGFVRPNGLKISKVRVPLGVVGIIYEARPNVTLDAIGLTLKTGNAVVLKGGKEAICSNRAIVQIASQAGEQAGMPKGAIGFIDRTDREATTYMMGLNGLVDVLIPRGGAGLIQSVVKNATIPVIETGVGNCHTYVDASADVNMAADIVINAKTSRPSVCNACESLLVHKDIADAFMPVILKRFAEKNVQVVGCERCRAYGQMELATPEDYAKEFLDYKISAKIVDNIDEAIAHITKYGTMHSECIVTKSFDSAQKFTLEVDAAAVYVNASTRFTDGFEFGFGAEIGISTQKLHARGPMGLRELTSTKYTILGDGQIR